jgi:hypothetical protein
MTSDVTLDDNLLEQARKLGNYRTKKAAAIAALKEFVARREKMKILDLKGKIEYDTTYSYKQERGRKR